MSSKFKRSALGARVPHEKKTSGMATVAMPLPEKIVLPMQQHIGAPCTPTVKKGDAVLVGTVVGAAGGFVGAAIHSGVSGTVEAVETVHMPNGRSVPAVVIRADGEQTPDPACVPPEVTDHASLIAAVQACGLVGLGGARPARPRGRARPGGPPAVRAGARRAAAPLGRRGPGRAPRAGLTPRR